MTPKEINALAHEIAEETAKADIDCNTLRVKTREGSFYNLASADRFGRFYVRRAAQYLDATKVLVHHLKRPNLVTWEGDDD